MSRVQESDRANALVEAGIEKEQEGQYREALEIYQKVIDEYPDVLLPRERVRGVRARSAEYCQLRILSFPQEHLEFYRTKYDSRAREAFELARQRNSLEGLAEIRDKMLATSYGGRSLMTLGYSALDQGPLPGGAGVLRAGLGATSRTAARRARTWPCPWPCAARCWARERRRRALRADRPLEARRGQRQQGRRLPPGTGNDGTIADPPHWMPGKVGGAPALRLVPNCVNVPAHAAMDVGVGGRGLQRGVLAQLGVGLVSQHPLRQARPRRERHARRSRSTAEEPDPLHHRHAEPQVGDRQHQGRRAGQAPGRTWRFVKAGDEVQALPGRPARHARHAQGAGAPEPAAA